ncbi:hypothetical protein L3X38_041553 [Prunus dulcis]|uniref:Uncharacterized protein n=1 Tax=Prunus dulcis TaxID=3755 RepID=A0AAD4UT68_PRUDU|nr:hypothetical protein L3X38_041553 [Prunus dulcis]
MKGISTPTLPIREDHNERLQEQQIGLQANQCGWKDACLARSRRPLPCLNRVTSSTAPTSRAPILRKSSLELNLKVAMKAMIKGEMKSIWDRLGKFERIHNSLASSFFVDEILLPYTKELLEATVVGDTKAPKISLVEGLTNPYDHLDSFCYAMDGRGANETTKCRFFSTTLKEAFPELVQTVKSQIHQFVCRAASGILGQVHDHIKPVIHRQRSLGSTTENGRIPTRLCNPLQQ